MLPEGVPCRLGCRKLSSHAHFMGSTRQIAKRSEKCEALLTVAKRPLQSAHRDLIQNLHPHQSLRRPPALRYRLQFGSKFFAGAEKKTSDLRVRVGCIIYLTHSYYIIHRNFLIWSTTDREIQPRRSKFYEFQPK